MYHQLLKVWVKIVIKCFKYLSLNFDKNSLFFLIRLGTKSPPSLPPVDLPSSHHPIPSLAQVENTGVQLIRQASAKTNDVAGDGTTSGPPGAPRGAQGRAVALGMAEVAENPRGKMCGRVRRTKSSIDISCILM